MNKTINRPEAGLILYHESGDEEHWMVVTPELFRIITSLVNSVPNNEWDNQREHVLFQEVCGILWGNTDAHEPHEGIIEDGFTQTWVHEKAPWLNKYEFIGMRAIPMY